MPYPSRAVLEGVPRIGYDVHLCPFPGSLFSLLTYLGEPQDYDYLMGISGAPFRRLYQRDDGGNVDLMHFSPEPERRALGALGFKYETIPPGDKARAVGAIKASMAAGMPVLGFGIIGPPECGLVTGYEEDGDVLLGYSYFADSHAGYYRQAEWEEKAEFPPGRAFVILGNRVPAPPPRETAVASLRWAVELAHTATWPPLPDHACGLAAYRAWADGLEVEADYPEDDGVLATRLMIHGDQAVMLEERRNAAGYLRQVAAILPEAAGHLQAAADLYEQTVTANMGAVWPWGEDMGIETARKLAPADTRRSIAAAICQAAATEERAVEEVEKALLVLGR